MDNTNANMRMAIITSDSYFSCLLISDLVKYHRDNIACIVITPSKVKGKSTLGSVLHVYKKTGFRNLVYKVVAGLWGYFAEALYKIGIVRHCITPSNLSRRYDIDLYHSQNCNDQVTRAYLDNKNIDVLLSVNVYQRMLEPLLALPKVAAVNNHFGLLPKYKGMAPYIWAMANGEKEIGLSIHHMVLKFDEGKLIRQERMPLEPNDSAMGVYIRGCLIARKMITAVIEEIKKNPSAGYEQSGKGSYYSMPTRQCVKDLRQRGYRLWSFKDLLKVLQTKVNNEMLP